MYTLTMDVYMGYPATLKRLTRSTTHATDTLEGKRLSLMRETYDIIYNLIDHLIENKPCQPLCPPALIGSLTMQLRSSGIDGLDWNGDMRGCSVQCLCDLVSEFTLTELVVTHGPGKSKRLNVHLCDLREKLGDHGFLPALEVAENLDAEALGYPSDS